MSLAAASGTALRVGGSEIPVFDLRTPVLLGAAPGGNAADTRTTGAAARDVTSSGCLLIGRRGPLHVALLVD